MAIYSQKPNIFKDQKGFRSQNDVGLNALQVSYKCLETWLAYCKNGASPEETVKRNGAPKKYAGACLGDLASPCLAGKTYLYLGLNWLPGWSYKNIFLQVQLLSLVFFLFGIVHFLGKIYLEWF